MIDALISGRLYGQAQEGKGQGGSSYVTCKLRLPTPDGDFIFCNVIAFNDDLQDQLLALGDGDAVALSGALTPKVWEDKQGNTRPAVDLVAHAVLTAYHVRQKRDAMLMDDEERDDNH
ncbi:single-stranded DNA-binding protein [Undibacterium sp. GrIS 1.8]|uniref:single-stranded DNA-binding protein n=1 Tax=unclassified Undibacterium TaxID=2630295 RepID=UPI0033987527